MANELVIYDNVSRRLVTFNLLGDHGNEINELVSSTDPPDLTSVCGVAYLSNYIYVTDLTHYKVLRFDVDLNYIDSFGGYGTGDGQFLGISGIAADRKNNRIIVCDRWGNRVNIFTTSGVYTTQFALNSSTDPEYIAVDPVSGTIYITNTDTYTIDRYDEGGTYISSFDPDDFPSVPMGLDVDYSGNIYVIDWYTESILKFNSSGVYQTSWSISGAGARDLSCDSDGYIYIYIVIILMLLMFMILVVLL